MRSVICAVLPFALIGCGGARLAKVSAPPSTPAASAASAAAAPQDSLATFIAKVRKLSEEARPERVPSATVEASNPRLAAAVAASALVPTSESLRAAAREYMHLGINDRAHDYFRRSLAVSPHDAAAYDALARFWRDSGFPQLGLGDAYRAVHYAPRSAIARNTLGTILHAIGHRKAARVEYERALQLDPSATYALTNVCYGWILEGNVQRASAACRRALQVDPGFAPARNNLALAQAVQGDLEGARRTFDEAQEPAPAQYNIGIVHLARREYAQALKAFEAARGLRPSLKVAGARIRQIEQVVKGGG